MLPLFSGTQECERRTVHIYLPIHSLAKRYKLSSAILYSFGLIFNFEGIGYEDDIDYIDYEDASQFTKMDVRNPS